MDTVDVVLEAPSTTSAQNAQDALCDLNASASPQKIAVDLMVDQRIPAMTPVPGMERLQLDPRKPNYLVSLNDHTSRKDWDPMVPLYRAREREAAARLEASARKVQLQRAKLEYEKQRLKSNRLKASAAYKEKMQEEQIALKTVEAAGDAEVKKLSELLNVSMTRRVIQPSWWKLFQMMDTDKTGMVPFDRFLRLLRKVLLVPEDRWPEQTLRAVFKAMDFAGDGYINSAKWGPFMRRGEGAVLRPGHGLPTWKERARRWSQKTPDGSRMLAAGRPQQVALLCLRHARKLHRCWLRPRCRRRLRTRTTSGRSAP